MENSKQIHLSIEERRTLARDLFRLNEPLEKLWERAQAVKSNTDYGRLSIDLWLAGRRLYTEQEAYALARKIIAERREQLSKLRFDEKVLERQALYDAELIAGRRYEEHMERHRMNVQARVKRARIFIKKIATDEQRLALRDIAVLKGVMHEEDPFWKDGLHIVAATLLKECEEMMGQTGSP